MKLKILTIVALLAVSACASKLQVQSGSRPVDQAPWFCHQTPDGDDWQCERTDSPPVPTATHNPVLDQAVPISDESPPPAGQAQPPPDKDSASSSPSMPTSSQPTSPATSATFTATSPALTPAPLPATAAAQASVPDHIRLAYRPQTPVSLLDLPATYYAAQLTALSSRDGLEQYALERGLTGLSGAPVASNGRVLYALLLGIYESREVAEQAIRGIEPTPLQPEIWLRSVGSLQRAMREALEIIQNDK